MKQPNVSVIIPAYNAANFVGHAIESALHQTAQPLEILVIDDGSHDATAATAAAFGSPVRVLRQANGGPAAARNAGARIAKGEWLAFLDADDRWKPHKLAAQLPLTADAAVGLVVNWEKPGEGAGSEGAGRLIDFETLWQGNRAVTSTALLRRKAWEGVGGFNEDRALIGVEDYNLWLRLAASPWQITRSAGDFYLYEPADNSLMSQSARMAEAELANIAAIAAEMYLDAPRVRRKRAAILNQYGRDLLYARNLPAARRLLLRAFREFPAPSQLVWLLAACAPTRLLDARRSVRADAATRGV